MSTALDVDIAALVGEMPADPCESTSHDPADKAHDDGPATHYARIHCPNCGFSAVKAYCQQFSRFIKLGPEMGYTLRCDCGYKAPAEEMATIIGPVRSM